MEEVLVQLKPLDSAVSSRFFPSDNGDNVAVGDGEHQRIIAHSWIGKVSKQANRSLAVSFACRLY